MSEQPICVYCNKGPFATLQEWAIHACHSRWDMAGTIEKLRAELKAAHEELATLKNAMWQVLSDMSAGGRCVCEATKESAIKSYVPDEDAAAWGDPWRTWYPPKEPKP